MSVSRAPSAFAESSTIAHYRIISLIGTGGMGEVYKAADTKLSRTVALKVLRPELLRDADKVRRFAQEARAASSLNHPAIVTIYDVGEADGADGGRIHYIAMEFVEGESLRRKMQDTITLPKFLQLLIEVADGLGRAHAAGVVHRDLKPDNVMVTPAGHAKIVDFGLAKLTQPDLLLTRDGDDGATLSLYESRDGIVMGTIGYMSPEQVEGRPVDHRSDVFSIGCILYEGITGRKPFHSTSLIDTLHKITSSEPEPMETTTDLERVCRRCLKKDPEERFQSIKDLAIELREILGAPATNERSAAAAPRRKRLGLAVAGTLLLAAIVAAWMLRPGEPDVLAGYRITPLATDAAYEGFPAWSPDGKSIAYVRDVDGILQIFVRSLDSPLPTQITHATRDCREPFWHPQGNRLYYISLAEDRDSLWIVGLAGGSPEVALENVASAAISPDGKKLAFLRETNEQGSFSLALWTASPINAPAQEYKEGQLAGRRFATGVIRFAHDNSKFALWGSIRGANDGSIATRQFWIIPQPGGAPYLALPPLSTIPRPFPFDWLLDDRRIVFGADYITSTPGMHLWIADTETGRLRPVTVTGGNESYPTLSPDGQRLVFTSEEADYDLISVALHGNSASPMLATARSERDPVWSPKRNEYAYITNRSGAEEIWLRSEDGRWERPIVTQADFGKDPTLLLSGLTFSPDGQQIAFQRRGQNQYRVWISPVAGGRPVPLVPDPGQTLYEDVPTWSPGGDSIAFIYSDNSGMFTLARIKIGAPRPVVIRENVVYPSNPQWAPRGDVITIELPDGLNLISADGSRNELVSGETWLAHTWSKDASHLYGVRLDDELHLRLSMIDVSTGRETLLTDLGPSPPIINPLQGLSVAPDGNSIATSIPRLKGDLWLLDGFDRRRSWREKIGLASSGK